MKLRNLFLGVCSAVAVFAACQPQEENLGTPDISIDKSEMTFEVAGGEQELNVTATRDWKVETDADWVVVSPESGSASLDPQTVTVTALENTGMDRSADLKFTIGMKSKYLTVSQAGPGGSVEALIVYFNDFDKEEATKTYGSSNGSWPYLDQFEGWKNATGTGAANVSYTFQGMSARANSTSDSNYSDYAGSGKNNMFFGSAAYFSTNNIALNGATGLTLTFGTEKYSQDNGSVFTNSEYKIYLSNDGAKWVELTDYTFAGGTTEGRWNLATASFSVPEGTETLSICMQVTVASSYRMDDMKLVISEGGAAIDFSKGVEMDFAAGNTGGNNGGGSSDATAIYSNNYDKSAAVQGSNGWPFLDSSDAWKNAAGTGAANVTYASKNVTVRNNSNSNGNYSDYDGSGLNNIFFGKDYPYFATKNIALNGATGLTLTFGTEKYSQTLGSTFTNSEYHIYLSNDGAKWVELTDYTFAGTADGRWNVATANFTVPAGTETLSICMQVDAESSYRLDDMKLVASEGGVAVDFSAAVEKDFNAGATGGGDNGGETPTPPAGGGTSMTIAEVLAYGGQLPSGSTIEGVVISNMDLNNLTSKKGMYVQDETAALQFYLAANHTFAYGDKVQIDLSGVTVGAYNGAVQVSGLALDKIAKVSSGNTVTPKTVTMADFLANKYEGQYIALEGVQVADSDLSNTFVMGGAHTSINMVDAAGNTFVVFSSKYATYGAQTVPQGSGTIKGISSINNGTMQIIFCQASDFAGLTNTRFDGTEVTPPAGGDDNQGGDDNGGTVTPPADGVGQYDIYGVTWTLGANAYDNTSTGTNTQSATVNGVSVPNLLKLGTSSKVGDATLHVASGTTKIGFYCVAWKGKTAQVKFSVGGTEVKTISPAANVGATGNAPYTALNVADSDYFEVELPAGATDIKVETLDANNGRVLFVGLQVK